MRRIESILSVSLGLGLSGGALAQDDALLLLPPASAPAAESPPKRESAAPGVAPTGSGDRTSVLAIPGLIPSSRPRTRVVPGTPEGTGRSTTGELPPLLGPSEMPAAVRDQNRPARNAAGGQGESLVLESVPRSEMEDLSSNRATPARRSVAPSSAPSAAPTAPKTASTKPKAEPPPPRRAPGLFGRMLPAPYRAPRSAAESDSPIKVEPSTDPASDAANKRRIEHQIRRLYGDKLGSVEVRVVGRDVTIRGRATRFWQRRGLKRALESMSSLSGMRPTIEVD